MNPPRLILLRRLAPESFTPMAAASRSATAANGRSVAPNAQWNGRSHAGDDGGSGVAIIG